MTVIFSFCAGFLGIEIFTLKLERAETVKKNKNGMRNF